MKEEKTSTKRRRYDAEFKSKLLELHKNGRSIPSLSSSFGINENVLYRWRKASMEAESTPPSAELLELKELRRQLKEVEQERDILKKALAIFSRKF